MGHESCEQGLKIVKASGAGTQDVDTTNGAATITYVPSGKFMIGCQWWGT